ncbi:related to sugar transport protein STP1 [Rhynchosporium agropyri]|uniref:Related to sugar transport protein STP1 n=1 Tax=Rhynchosporium agropyri TaxID=914238 RepID=A0A1E1LEF2_9HELO|nr:related to sugar transport protein STP1 [Rhynchosporium agropyri]
MHSTVPTFTIPSSNPPRRPANIPLRTLPTQASRSDSHSAALLGRTSDEKQGRRSSLSRSSSPSSEFSWSDTGDLAEQLADAEDPLRLKLRASLDEQVLGGSSKRTSRHKKVRYQDEGDSIDLKEYSPALVKEDIEIPDPGPRYISRAEHLLAAAMSGGERQMRGLTGKSLVYFTSIFVSLGVFLFGYDQGVMSGIITGPYFKDYFNQPTKAEVGTMVAILEVGAFFSSLCVGRIGDIIGRRRTILYGSMIFFVGGGLQTLANGMPMMLLGRIIAGVGVGMLSTIVPVYQSEISPPHNRGKLACIEFTGNIFGYATSVWVDYFCSYINSDYSWRIPLLMQCIMGALLGIGSLVIVESPRWLLDNDHDEEGIVVIANLYGEGDIHNAKARDEFREIKMDVLLSRQEGEKSYADMFKRYRTRVFIAMSAQALAQLNGINVISYYAPLVFESAGWIGRQAILMTGINSITYLMSSIPPWYLVDRWGRRFILLSGAIAMAISLSLISYFLFLDIATTPTLVVIFVMIYNAAFGFSWGPIPWLYPPEILPLSIRSKGTSLSTATNWAFNWLVGELTPVLQETIKWRLYLVHAFFCVTSFVVVYFIYPETAGIRLEDMDVLFGDATTAMPTPQARAESGLLMGGASSPVPSMDLRRGIMGGSGGQPPHLGASNAIPGLDIDPPHVRIENGKPIFGSVDNGNGEGGEGVGGWISRMVKRAAGDGEGSSGGGSRGSSVKSGKYKALNDDELDD